MTVRKNLFGPPIAGEEILARIKGYEELTANEASVPMRRHRLPGHLVSDGAWMLAWECGLWLVIDTVLDQQITRALRASPIQVWTLTPGKGRHGTEFNVDDDAGNHIHSCGLAAPRLPIPELVLWYVRPTPAIGAVMLPCEYAMPANRTVAEPTEVEA